MIKFKTIDIIVIVLSLSAAITSGFIIYSNFTPPELLEITCREGTIVYRLEQDKNISIQGPLGESKVIIENKLAFFQHSPCPDKLCIKTGQLGKSGEWAGCLPNMIFIRITGEEKKNEKIDSISF